MTLNFNFKTFISYDGGQSFNWIIAPKTDSWKYIYKCKDKCYLNLILVSSETIYSKYSPLKHHKTSPNIMIATGNIVDDT